MTLVETGRTAEGRYIIQNLPDTTNHILRPRQWRLIQGMAEDQQVRLLVECVAENVDDGLYPEETPPTP